MSVKVFVGNLPYTTTESHLADLLAESGQVVDVYLPSDRATGKPQGHAVVEFSRPEEAAACIARFNGSEVGGRRVEVRIADG